jgi:hypothetical protein
MNGMIEKMFDAKRLSSGARMFMRAGRSKRQTGLPLTLVRNVGQM